MTFCKTHLRIKLSDNKKCSPIKHVKANAAKIPCKNHPKKFVRASLGQCGGFHCIPFSLLVIDIKVVIIADAASVEFI